MLVCLKIWWLSFVQFCSTIFWPINYYIFLAYFQILKKYAIVRTLSVCPSVDATTFHGVDRLGRFMVRSITYDPRIRMTKGFFFWPVLGLVGGVWSPIPFVFHIEIGFYWYLRRAMSPMLIWMGRRSKVGGDESGWSLM